jgi:CheY-like chemotaxis protein
MAFVQDGILLNWRPVPLFLEVHMFRVLVLDDSPERLEAFSKILKGCQARLVSTSEAARVALIEDEPFDLVCLDHDLGEFGAVRPGNGMEVAQFIARNMRDKIPRWVLIHSSNVPAAERMVYELDKSRISVMRSAYSTKMLKELSGWIKAMEG